MNKYIFKTILLPLSCRMSLQEIFLIWSNVQLSLYEKAVFTEKNPDEFRIAIATLYDLFVFFKSSPGNKVYEQCSAN